MLPSLRDETKLHPFIDSVILNDLNLFVCNNTGFQKFNFSTNFKHSISKSWPEDPWQCCVIHSGHVFFTGCLLFREMRFVAKGTFAYRCVMTECVKHKYPFKKKQCLQCKAQIL